MTTPAHPAQAATPISLAAIPIMSTAGKQGTALIVQIGSIPITIPLPTDEAVRMLTELLEQAKEQARAAKLANGGLQVVTQATPVDLPPLHGMNGGPNGSPTPR